MYGVQFRSSSLKIDSIGKFEILRVDVYGGKHKKLRI